MPTHQSREKEMTYTDRRAQIVPLYLSGWTQAALSEKFGVNQSTISRDLEAIRKQWLESALLDFHEARIVELERINQLEREYWGQYERSKKPKIRTTKKARKVDKKEYQEASETIEERLGDARYLDGVQWCISRRCRLLGLDEPESIRLLARSSRVEFSADDLADAHQRVADFERQFFSKSKPNTEAQSAV